MCFKLCLPPPSSSSSAMVPSPDRTYTLPTPRCLGSVALSSMGASFICSCVGGALIRVAFGCSCDAFVLSSSCFLRSASSWPDFFYLSQLLYLVLVLFSDLVSRYFLLFLVSVALFPIFASSHDVVDCEASLFPFIPLRGVRFLCYALPPLVVELVLSVPPTFHPVFSVIGHALAPLAIAFFPCLSRFRKAVLLLLLLRLSTQSALLLSGLKDLPRL